MSQEDIELDRQWRAAYGQPLPILGSGDIVRTILATLPDGMDESVDRLAPKAASTLRRAG